MIIPCCVYLASAFFLIDLNNQLLTWLSLLSYLVDIWDLIPHTVVTWVIVSSRGASVRARDQVEALFGEGHRTFRRWSLVAGRLSLLVGFEISWPYSISSVPLSASCTSLKMWALSFCSDGLATPAIMMDSYLLEPCMHMRVRMWSQRKFAGVGSLLPPYGLWGIELGSSGLAGCGLPRWATPKILLTPYWPHQNVVVTNM